MIDHDEIVTFMQKLRNQGCAVVVFLPSELYDVNPEHVEESMILEGNITIDMFREHEDSEGDE